MESALPGEITSGTDFRKDLKKGVTKVSATGGAVHQAAERSAGAARAWRSARHQWRQPDQWPGAGGTVSRGPASGPRSPRPNLAHSPSAIIFRPTASIAAP